MTRRVVGSALALAVSVVLAVPVPALSDSGAFYEFQSPSGNIGCVMSAEGDVASARCDIRDRTYAVPARPPIGSGECPIGGGWGDSLSLTQGGAAVMHCHTDSAAPPPAEYQTVGDPPILNYGDSHTLGAITCNSESAGVTCTDTSTGHFFRISRDTYELH